jgi:hypothetical protein
VTKNIITGLTPTEDKKNLTPNMYIAHNYSILSDYTTKIYDLQLKLNGKGNKFDQIKFCVSFECKWNTFPSSTLGIIIFLVN